ncbi:hypothetical protein SEA_CIRCINUS_170 [Streptomyces phage Circinus]|uniref:Uncharacterized protein n=1 Tax=Streptomyces phage Circinus TaxID=2562189 RepID=A0A4D6E1P8_9CAUD|nr:hypothetical protein SEA_CIRCINUS_170 [Streptomyces phage Circinus]
MDFDGYVIKVKLVPGYAHFPQELYEAYVDKPDGTPLMAGMFTPKRFTTFGWSVDQAKRKFRREIRHYLETVDRDPVRYFSL